MGLSGLLAPAPASPLFWINSPVQVTLFPYACFLNITELPQADSSEVWAHSKWLASAVDTYCQGSLLTFLLAWGPPMSQYPFDITYRDQLLRISVGHWKYEFLLGMRVLYPCTEGVIAGFFAFASYHFHNFPARFECIDSRISRNSLLIPTTKAFKDFPKDSDCFPNKWLPHNNILMS